VLKFQQADVSHVLFNLRGNDDVFFTKNAQQQGFKPKYLLIDNARISSGPDATQQQDPDNFDGAINITNSRYAEPFTPGLRPDAGTVACDKTFTAKGLPPVWQQQVGYGGVICSILTFLKGMIDNAPRLEGEALQAAMGSLGRQTYSFPQGDVDYTGAGTNQPYGRGLWRTAQWHKSCRCWQVLDPTFRTALVR
jgi:hypothetical protein